MNVYIKSGRLRVYDGKLGVCDDDDHDYNLCPIMTGWFKATRVLSEARGVLWASNKLCCDNEEKIG